MMKPFFILMISIFSIGNNFNQKCIKEKLINLYLKENLESDIYYYLDFEKKDVPRAELFYFEKEIPSTLKVFEKKKKKSKKRAKFNDLSKEKRNSNYVVFNTGFIDNTIVLEIFFNREDFLNIPGKSEYETWRRQNGGMNYLFEFDKKGRLINFKKKPILYE